MPLVFFSIPARDSGPAQAELNAFLRSNRVLAVDRRFVDDGPNSYWAVCVDHLDPGAARPGAPTGVRPKIDYKDVLTPAEFSIFAKLRDWRKQTALAEAVPVYAVFTNEQLAEMVKTKATTKAALGTIEGVGDARIEKYGPAALGILGTAWGQPSG